MKCEILFSGNIRKISPVCHLLNLSIALSVKVEKTDIL